MRINKKILLLIFAIGTISLLFCEISFGIKNIKSPESTLKRPIEMAASQNSDEGKEVFRTFSKMQNDNEPFKKLIQFAYENRDKVDQQTYDQMFYSICKNLQKNSKAEPSFQYFLNSTISERSSYEISDSTMTLVNKNNNDYTKIYNAFKKTFPKELGNKEDIFKIIMENPSLIDKFEDKEIRTHLKTIYDSGYSFEMQYKESVSTDNLIRLGSPVVPKNFVFLDKLNDYLISKYCSKTFAEYLALPRPYRYNVVDWGLSKLNLALKYENFIEKNPNFILNKNLEAKMNEAVYTLLVFNFENSSELPPKEQKIKDEKVMPQIYEILKQKNSKICKVVFEYLSLCENSKIKPSFYELYITTLESVEKNYRDTIEAYRSGNLEIREDNGNKVPTELAMKGDIMFYEKSKKRLEQLKPYQQEYIDFINTNFPAFNIKRAQDLLLDKLNEIKETNEIYKVENDTFIYDTLYSFYNQENENILLPFRFLKSINNGQLFEVSRGFVCLDTVETFMEDMNKSLKPLTKENLLKLDAEKEKYARELLTRRAERLKQKK